MNAQPQDLKEELLRTDLLLVIALRGDGVRHAKRAAGGTV